MKASKAINQLQEENGKMKEIIKNIEVISEQHKKEIEKLNSIVNTKNKEIETLDNIIREAENYEYDEEDFQDCLND